MLGQILQRHTSDVNDKQGLDARINHEGDGAWVTVFRNIGSRFTFRTKIQEKSIESTTAKFNRSQNRWQIKESFGTGAGTMEQSRECRRQCVWGVRRRIKVSSEKSPETSGTETNVQILNEGFKPDDACLRRGA